jgi:hypothetical protein
VTVKDAQVRKLMEEMTNHGQLGRAALRAGMDRKTARKYVQCGQLPSGRKRLRGYRTRPDPFDADWAWLEAQLELAPELEAKVLFEALQARQPGRYQDGQLRTLQRRLRQWRAEHGPEREVFFSQQHRPGEAMQLDFTRTAELCITIAGVPFEHMLCNAVLPYSNWQAVTVCLSESYLALKRGVQDAVFRIGRVPEYTQTDNSTSATHNLPAGKRDFNDEYRALIEYFGMTPRTTGIGEKEQNGDVEAANGALKRRILQELMLRGSSDFDTVEAYEAWLRDVVRRRNLGRQSRFEEERAVMRKLDVARLSEFVETLVPVTSWSTIRVNYCTYSVPSRLIGERVRVRVYERVLEVYYAERLQLSVERLKGRNRHRINYRHVIWSLVQKPGAFARYRYREEMFPTLTFRRAFDAISAQAPDLRGDLQYLRLLHLAAATTETEVEAAIAQLLEAGQCPDADQVKVLLGQAEVNVPDIEPYHPELASFDALLGEVAP